MAQGIARPDKNKAEEAGGNLEKVADDAARQRRLAEEALLKAMEIEGRMLSGAYGVEIR